MSRYEVDCIGFVFHDVIEGDVSPEEAQARLSAVVGNEFCNGYWFGEPGMRPVRAPLAPAAEVMAFYKVRLC